MRPQLTTVKAVQKYRLAISFDDGTEGLLDLAHLAGKGVFAAWDEGNLFFAAHVSDTGAIAWNEELDLDALNAYLTLRGMTFDEWKEYQLAHATD